MVKGNLSRVKGGVWSKQGLLLLGVLLKTIANELLG